MNNTPITHADNNKICSGANNGFTLLELMIVIVIVGIMFSFLALSFRSNSPEEAIKKEAERLDQLIQIALEQAILRGKEYAIIFTPNSYQFAHLTPNGWQAIEKDRLLRPRELPSDIVLELAIEKSDISFSSDEDDGKKNKLEPQVFLLSSGEITPEFSVSMLIFGVDTSYRIVGQANGQISAEPDAF